MFKKIIRLNKYFLVKNPHSKTTAAGIASSRGSPIMRFCSDRVFGKRYLSKSFPSISVDEGKTDGSEDDNHNQAQQNQQVLGADIHRHTDNQFGDDDTHHDE